MVSNDKFCLRWNDFETNISGAFREIRDDKDLFDCTLSCGSKQIQAHKLILSACSPFFRSILRQNPHQHPLLYLKGVDFIDLQSVLSFMYHGEVNVAQEELNSFLAVAEDLKVKGLTQNTSDSNITTTPTKPIPKPTPNVAPPPLVSLKPKVQLSKDETPRRQAPAVATGRQAVYQEKQQYREDSQEVMTMVKTEPEQVTYPSGTQTPLPSVADQQTYHSNELASMEESYDGEAGYEYSGYGGEGEPYEEGQYGVEGGAEQNKESSDEMILESNGQFECSLCGRGFPMKKTCRRHVLNVHSDNQKIICSICHKYLKNQTSLKTHLRGSHGVYQK